ncbi:MAG: spore coat associated protein CotJA [Lachnospiraceae bacterium]|nr:spore coat associated protein CotJA [Candidatus Fimimorpha excrementavium]
MDYRCGTRRPDYRSERTFTRNQPSANQTNCFGNTLSANPIGMAYVPRQKFGNLYDWETGFSQGTIFADLDKPFMAAMCTGRCRR